MANDEATWLASARPVWLGMVMPSGPMPPEEADWAAQFWKLLAAMAEPTTQALLDLAIVIGLAGPLWVPMALENRAAEKCFVKAWYNLGLSQQAAGRPDEALASFAKAFESGDKSVAMVAANLCSAIGDYDSALQWAEQLGDTECLGAVAENLGQLGDKEGKRKALTQTMHECWECAVDWVAERYQPFDVNEAFHLLEHHAEAHPEPELLVPLSALFFETGRQDQAEAALARASLKVDPIAHERLAKEYGGTKHRKVGLRFKTYSQDLPRSLEDRWWAVDEVQDSDAGLPDPGWPIRSTTNTCADWREWRPVTLGLSQIPKQERGRSWGIAFVEPEEPAPKDQWLACFWGRLTSAAGGDGKDLIDLCNALGVDPGWWAVEALVKRAALEGLAEAWHVLGIVLAGAGKPGKALHAFDNAYAAGVKVAAASAATLCVRTGRFDQVQKWSARAFPTPFADEVIDDEG